MQRLKFSNYLSKEKLFFYVQLVVFATIPLLSIRYLRVSLYGSSFPIFFVFVIFGIGLFFFTKHYHRELRVDKDTFLFIILIFIFIMFQTINGFKEGFSMSSLDEVIKTFSSLIVFIFIFYILKNTIFKEINNLIRLFQPAIFISTVILLILIIRYYFYFDSKYLGITLEFRTETGKNQLALYLGMMFPIVFNNFQNKRNIFTFMYMLVHAVSIIYVDSRGVLFCLFLSYVFTIIFLKHRPRIQFITILLLIMGLSVSAFILIQKYSIIANRFNALNVVKDVHLYRSNEMREILAVKSIYFFKDSPLIGIGTNKFLDKVGTLTHDSYLQILCEQGIVGFLIFLLIVFVVLNIIRNLSKYANKTEQAFIISSLVPIFYFAFINAYNLMLIYVFWAVLFVLNNYHLKYEYRTK